jgi:aromatic-L-amino-acid decarboxylase
LARLGIVVDRRAPLAWRVAAGDHMSEWTKSNIEQFGAAVSQFIAEHWTRLEEAHVFPGVAPQDMDAAFASPLPRTGTDPQTVLNEFIEKIWPYCMMIPSPNYYGLINPTPTVISIFADALASALNQNVGGWSQSPSATTVERQVIHWLCEMVGYDQKAFGTFTTGGTMANITGLKLALHAKAPSVAEHGLASVGRPVVFYVSEEAHFSIDRAADLIGVGKTNVRKIRTDAQFKVEVDDLVRQIEQDLEADRLPCAIVGIAGATSTGAVDPLNDLADVAARYGLWLHVDAAYGGAAILSERAKPLFEGLQRADSIAVDPHKWFFVPFEAGAILVKDGQTLRATFDARPAYIPQTSSVTGEETLNFFQLGVQGSRRFSALKLWMSLKHLGADWYAEVVERQIELCRYLARLVEAHPDFEACSPVTLGIFCFRYFPESWQREFRQAPEPRRQEINDLLNDLNLRIQMLVEQSGKAWFSTTVLKGVRALRINVLSYRTRQEHIDRLFNLIQEKAVLASSPA